MIVVAPSERSELDRARQEIMRLIVRNELVIRVINAEQANLAQRVVKEAGRKR